jgi:hypothetical protein
VTMVMRLGAARLVTGSCTHCREKGRVCSAWICVLGWESPTIGFLVY